MMAERMHSGLNAHDGELLDLRDAVKGIEHALDLDEGILIRKLTEVVRRRQTFENLRRQFDCRHRRT